MDLVFVILHYMTIEETQKCINYIQNNVDTLKYHIVIVDNASSNGTGLILTEQYKNDENVTVLLNEKNLGFSKGNNVGFRYAKKYLNPRFIVMLNNDVYLLEKKIMLKLNDEYLKSGFYVAGPMIMTGDGRCDVNPDVSPFRKASDIDKSIAAFSRRLKRYKYNYAPIFYKLAGILDMILGRYNKPKMKKDYLNRCENVKLHGCCMFFSEKYIAEYDGLDESTFLYCEEEFLYKHMKCNNKLTVYIPDIVVFHQEDVATDSIVAGEKEKMILWCENNIKSLKALKDVYLYYESIDDVKRS